MEDRAINCSVRERALWLLYINVSTATVRVYFKVREERVRNTQALLVYRYMYDYRAESAT